MQLRADQTLRKCAIQKGDEKILAVTSRDIVAAEAHYHVSCYKNYTRDGTKIPEYKDKINKVNEKDELPRIAKLKQRSLSIEHQELPVYLTGTRVVPQPLPTRENQLQEAKKAAQPACIKNLMWILARQANSECQTIPSWPGTKYKFQKTLLSIFQPLMHQLQR